MNKTSLTKAGILTLVLVSIAVASWEFYVRSKGFETTYDDNPALWSDKRTMVYEPADKATVFIGSSRIKFDLDIALWEKTTGDHAIQLACVGSSPRPVLDDLANDPRFKGKLVVDVTEVLFFAYDYFSTETPNDNIKYYKDRTPAQRASFVVNHLLESQFAFLDKDRLSLNAKLDELHIPNRKGVFQMPIFPGDFGRVRFDRQEFMTDQFAADTNMQNQVKGIWEFFRKMSTDPPASGGKLDSIMTSVKVSVDKIKARGGQVIFVRTPSSGGFLMGETMGYPREKYWDRLLTETKCAGIHFKDYPAIDHFECPELSHLKQSDAKIFTENFIKILNEEKGWAFSRLPAPVK